MFTWLLKQCEAALWMKPADPVIYYRKMLKLYSLNPLSGSPTEQSKLFKLRLCVQTVNDARALYSLRLRFSLFFICTEGRCVSVSHNQTRTGPVFHLTAELNRQKHTRKIRSESKVYWCCREIISHSCNNKNTVQSLKYSLNNSEVRYDTKQVEALFNRNMWKWK